MDTISSQDNRRSQRQGHRESRAMGSQSGRQALGSAKRNQPQDINTSPQSVRFHHSSGDSYDEAERGYSQHVPRDSEEPLNHNGNDFIRGEDRTRDRPALPRTFTAKFRQGDTYDEDINTKTPTAEKVVYVRGQPQSKRHWRESDLKNHIVAAIGEFVGTTMFLFFAFTGTAVANIPQGNSSSGGNPNTTTSSSTGFNLDVQLYVALAFGFSLMVNVWVFYRVSGGLFNPAVTLALMLIRAISPVRAAVVFVAQIAGGIAAAGLASCMFPTALNVRTTLGPGTSLVQGVFIEALLTFELIFTIFMLAAEKHKATFVAPVAIGLALFIAEMTGVYYTGGSLNPARSFGPCVVSATFDTEHWIYWVGPFAGALFAVLLYKIIKFMQYEFVNPGQDAGD